MAITLQRTGKPSTAQAAATTTYYLAGSGPSLTANATESNRQVVVRTAGTTSKLAIMVTANDRAASTLRLRKNTANGNQSAAITASTTGQFEDAVNTDAIAATDVFNYQLVTGAGGTTFVMNSISHLFDSSVNTSQRLVVHIAGAIADEEWPLSGVQAGSAIAGNQLKTYSTCTIKNLAVLVSANTRDGDCTVSLRKNAAGEALTVTIPASTAGLFEDTTNSSAGVNGDLFCWRTVRGGAAGACTVQYIAGDRETTDRKFVLPSFGSNPALAATTVFYTVSASNINSTAAEVDAQTQARANYTLTNLRVFIATNTIVGDSTYTLRKNGADTALFVTITSLTAGEFEDIVDSVPVIASDLLSYEFTGGGAGTSLLVRNSQMTATADGGGGSTLLLMGVG